MNDGGRGKGINLLKMQYREGEFKEGRRGGKGERMW